MTSNDLTPVSDKLILTISALGFFSIGVLLYIFVFDHQSRRVAVVVNGDVVGDEDIHNHEINRVQRRARDHRLRRRRGGDVVVQQQQNHYQLAAAAAAAVADVVQVENERLDNEQDTIVAAQQQIVVTRRDRIKAAKLAEREQRRIYEEERRQELQQKKLAEEEAYLERLHQNKVDAERERKADDRLLKERREKEERTYNQSFAVIVAARTSSSCDDSYENENFLNNCVSFIKERKVVPLTLLGRQLNKHNMTTEETLKLIKSLEEKGLINGIVDAQGNYVYIDPQTVEEIMKYISESGRVSTSVLSNAVRSFISKQPSKVGF